MLLTIFGAFIGLYLSWIIGKCLGMDFDKRYEVGSFIFLMSGMALGAGIGLGWGASLLTTGNHPYNYVMTLLFKK